MNGRTVAIIGGGFCGVMLLANLVRKATIPVRIILIERNEELAKGISYGTTDPNHLLNVQAIRMGAFPDEPEHFFHWVMTHENFWRKASPSFAHLKITPRSFFPRMIYGIYLESLLLDSLEIAKNKGLEVSILPSEVTDLQLENHQVRLFLKKDRILDASIAILAIGLPPSKNLAFPPHPNYFHNIWDLTMKSFFQSSRLSKLSKTAKILIIGSGLTMIDACLTLINQEFPGQIIVISKEGRLPEKHRKMIKAYPLVLNSQNYPKKASQLLKIFRQQLALGKEKGYDWRSIVDALRPITVPIWIQLPLKEKQRFLRCLLSVWNRHRHRSPPESLEKIERHRKNQKLTLHAGRVLSIEENSDQKLLVKYAVKGLEDPRFLVTDYVFNCSGSETNLSKNNEELVKNMLKNGFIQPDDLNLGIQVTAEGGVEGKAKGKLFAVGQLLFGSHFETIAVPELRSQCAKLAHHLLSILSN